MACEGGGEVADGGRWAGRAVAVHKLKRNVKEHLDSRRRRCGGKSTTDYINNLIIILFQTEKKRLGRAGGRSRMGNAGTRVAPLQVATRATD